MKKYIVMECHLSYAVVLDEEGNFLKVANLHYEVGQTVTDVIEMQISKSVLKKNMAKKLYLAAAVAASVVLMATSVFRMRQMTYASVYMTINPEVRIDVNRKDIVVGLAGVNSDGENLIEGYHYKKKDLDLVMDELVDRAIEMEYLHEGGQISLVLDAKNNQWIIEHSDELTEQINRHLQKDNLSITIEVTDTSVESEKIIIPVPTDENSYGESDYGEKEVTPQEPVDQTPVQNSEEDSLTDYEEPDAEGQSNYEADDDQENFQEGQSDYEIEEDGESSYESEDD